MSATAARTDAQVLQEVLRGMSVQAQRAFLQRGFGPAVTARLGLVEGLSEAELAVDGFGRWLGVVLDHAGLDASMIELFHVVGGVPWQRCMALARAVRIPVTDVPPVAGAPAEHARGAVVLTVAGPPDRERWATRSLLAAIQGIHRRLEADPALRSPAARPLLTGVSEDERHLVLRADPATVRALLMLKPEELRTVTGLPVSGIAGAAVDARSHRPVVLALTTCVVVILACLVAKQRQLATVWTNLHETRAELALVMAAPPGARQEQAAVVVADVHTETEPEADAVAVAVAPVVTPTLSTQEGLRAVDGAPAAWMTALGTRIDQTGAAVELRGGQVTVAFSDELLAFEPGEAVLSETAARPLRTVARFLSEHPSLDVWVEGHTDAAAFSSGNWLLGAQRALAVVEALTRYGVPARRIALTSHGEHRPVAPNSTADGRRKNRRVEIVLAESGSR